MTDKELFELCKEVYEKTGWKDQLQFFDGYLYNGEHNIETVGGWESEGASYSFDSRHNIPLYTSDYLLERLPTKVNGYKWLSMEKRTNYYAVSYGTSGGGYAPDNYKEWYPADTPLKALLKQTIALHDAGELDKGDKGETNG